MERLKRCDEDEYNKAPEPMQYPNFMIEGGGGSHGMPGYFGNGPGLGGIYYDNISGTFRSTAPGNNEVTWQYAYSVAENYASERWWREYAYAGSGKYMAEKGSVLRYEVNGEVSNVAQADGGGTDIYDKTSMGLFGGGVVLDALYRKQVPMALDGITDLTMNATLKGIGRIASRAGTVAAVVNGVVASIKYFSINDPTWGQKTEYGIALLSSGLGAVPNPYTTAASLIIGGIDISGGFTPLYDAMNANEKFYNATGQVLIPVPNGGYPVIF